MEIDINVIRGLTTLVLLLAFIGLIFWVYHPKSKKSFDDAAELPFQSEAPDNIAQENREQDV